MDTVTALQAVLGYTSADGSSEGVAPIVQRVVELTALLHTCEEKVSLALGGRADITETSSRARFIHKGVGTTSETQQGNNLNLCVELPVLLFMC